MTSFLKTTLAAAVVAVTSMGAAQAAVTPFTATLSNISQKDSGGNLSGSSASNADATATKFFRTFFSGFSNGTNVGNPLQFGGFRTYENGMSPAQFSLVSYTSG